MPHTSTAAQRASSMRTRSSTSAGCMRTAAACRATKARRRRCSLRRHRWVIHRRTTFSDSLPRCRGARRTACARRRCRRCPRRCSSWPYRTRTQARIRSPRLPPWKQQIAVVVDKLAPKFAISRRLALAVIAVESNFAWDALSDKGAAGLMQLMPRDRRSLQRGARVRRVRECAGRACVSALAAGLLSRRRSPCGGGVQRRREGRRQVRRNSAVSRNSVLRASCPEPVRKRHASVRAEHPAFAGHHAPGLSDPIADSAVGPVLDPIWVKAVLKVIVLPPCGPLLVSLAGLAIIRRRPRTGRLLARAWRIGAFRAVAPGRGVAARAGPVRRSGIRGRAMRARRKPS